MKTKIFINAVCVLVSIMFVLVFTSEAPAPGTASISLVKSCTDASGPGEPILFSATLTNTGEDNIINITCADVPPTALTGVPTSLLYGQSATITGSYIPASNPSTDTITCNGTGQYTSRPVTASASATCRYAEDGRCTLTPGYWKTHSQDGPARYDTTWAAIGEDTIFYLSGQSYYVVLWMTPERGNAYYILAHQFIAAKLNIAKGASVPINVQTAITASTNLFNTYTPANIGALKGGDVLRAQFISIAGILDAYNNGLIGPGHCR